MSFFLRPVCLDKRSACVVPGDVFSPPCTVRLSVPNSSSYGSLQNVLGMACTVCGSYQLDLLQQNIGPNCSVVDKFNLPSVKRVHSSYPLYQNLQIHIEELFSSCLTLVGLLFLGCTGISVFCPPSNGGPIFGQKRHSAADTPSDEAVTW